MDLVRDLLDKKVVDRNGRDMGRVDSIVLDVVPDRPPEVAGIEIGPSVQAARLHPTLGRWIEALEHAIGLGDTRLRVPLGRVLSIGDVIKVDFAVGETPAGVVEERLRLWVRRIPGA